MPPLRRVDSELGRTDARVGRLEVEEQRNLCRGSCFKSLPRTRSGPWSPNNKAAYISGSLAPRTRGPSKSRVTIENIGAPASDGVERTATDLYDSGSKAGFTIDCQCSRGEKTPSSHALLFEFLVS